MNILRTPVGQHSWQANESGLLFLPQTIVKFTDVLTAHRNEKKGSREVKFKSLIKIKPTTAPSHWEETPKAGDKEKKTETLSEVGLDLS